MNSQRSRSFILSIALIVLCGAGGLIDCSGSQEDLADELMFNCDYNINRFLLSQLSQHRAVMLADAGHGSPVYMQGVIEFLNCWLDTLEHNPDLSVGVPTKLFLVLERDPVTIQRLKSYFVSGNLMETFESDIIPSNNFTTADLEYYSDLRRFRRRVDEHNARTDSTGLVSFDIFGPEKTIDIDNWSFQKADDYFFSERDEYSSAKIMELLEGNPDWKVLIYYGRSHLNKSLALKKGRKESKEGYYLGHYLEQKLRDKGGLATIYQGRDIVFVSPICKVLAPEYGVDIHDLNPGIVSEEVKLEGVDGFIVRSDELSQRRPVSWVRSESSVKMFLNFLSAGPDTTNDFHRSDFCSSLRYLTVISGQELDTVNGTSEASVQTTVKKWKDWYGSAGLDIVADLQSGAPLSRLLDHMSRSSGSLTTKYESLIAAVIGCEPFFDTTLSPVQRAQTYRERLEYDRKPILIDNLVHLLWVATDEERAKALQVLQKETGQEFVEAKDWMVWYRQNYRKIWNEGI